MPFDIVDRSKDEYAWLTPFVNLREIVLSQFLDNYDIIEFGSPGFDGRVPQTKVAGWRIALIETYIESKGIIEHRTTFPEISELFKNTPENIDIISCSISELDVNMDKNNCHKGNYNIEEGYNRYYIPLRSTSTPKIVIEEDDGYQQYSWNVGECHRLDDPTRFHCQQFDSEIETESNIVLVLEVLESQGKGLSLSDKQTIMGKSKSTTVRGVVWNT